MSNLAVLVDEDDKVIGHKSRYDLEEGDIIRIALLWIENSAGQVLLAQRSLSKEIDPGLWAAAAGGTVEEGETYESNINKEAEEEIGLTGIKFEEYAKDFFWRPDGVGRFATWYRAIVDRSINEFTLQKEEVGSVAWFDKQELQKQLKENPAKFAPSSVHWQELGLI